MNSISQPFKTYNGGKSGNGVYQQIINFIPQCDVFIDAMVGNGGIVSKIKLPYVIVINDIDAGVINAFQDHTAINNYEDPSSGVPVINNYVSSTPRKVIKENMHVQYLIAKYDYEISRTFFYFDPPYLKSVRRSDKDLYKYEWTQEDHLRFLSKVVTMKSQCMISHYPCELYDHFLAGWNKHTFEAQTRGGKAVECIYMNYEQPAILQDYQYLGKNFIERQQIKRKVNRWVNRLEALPMNERTAILSSIIAKYNYTAGKLLSDKN